MKRLLFALGIWIILSACVEERSHEQHRLERWIGRSKDDLLRKWGLPETAVRNPDGSEVLTYAREIYQFDHTALGLPRLAEGPHFAGYHYRTFFITPNGIVRSCDVDDGEPSREDRYRR